MEAGAPFLYSRGRESGGREFGSALERVCEERRHGPASTAEWGVALWVRVGELSGKAGGFSGKAGELSGKARGFSGKERELSGKAREFNIKAKESTR